MTSIFSYKSQHAFQQICLISLCELQLALRVISAAALVNLSPPFNHYSHICTSASVHLRRHICTGTSAHLQRHIYTGTSAQAHLHSHICTVTSAEAHLHSHIYTGDPLKTTVCVWGSKQATECLCSVLKSWPLTLTPVWVTQLQLW